MGLRSWNGWQAGRLAGWRELTPLVFVGVSVAGLGLEPGRTWDWRHISAWRFPLPESMTLTWSKRGIAIFCRRGRQLGRFILGNIPRHDFEFSIHH